VCLLMTFALRNFLLPIRQSNIGIVVFNQSLLSVLTGLSALAARQANHVGGVLSCNEPFMERNLARQACYFSECPQGGNAAQ
jgi:hypothetical protein